MSIEHKAKVKSIKKLSHGVVVAVQCCDETETSHILTLQDSTLSDDAILKQIEETCLFVAKQHEILDDLFTRTAKLTGLGVK